MHLRAKKTWILEDGGVAVGTITADRDADGHWPEPQRSEPAIYIHRLVVELTHSGRDLGAQLIDWAAQSTVDGDTADWIRVNAWESNEDLHRYYLRQGFAFVGHAVLHEDEPDYPAGALFQRPSDLKAAPRPFHFHEIPSAG